MELLLGLVILGLLVALYKTRNRLNQEKDINDLLQSEIERLHKQLNWPRSPVIHVKPLAKPANVIFPEKSVAQTMIEAFDAPNKPSKSKRKANKKK